MTREEAKELLPIMQAFADGKQIQYRISPRVSVPCKALEMPEMPVYQDIRWRDFDEEKYDGFCCDGTVQYRIKPEVEYRPFGSKEEYWEEMMKHNEFGWVKSKTRDANKHISNIEKDIEGNVWFVATSFSGIEKYSPKQMLDYFVFMDGEPFGIKEE